MTVVIAKCEFTYIQLAKSAMTACASAQAFTLGSKKRPSPLLDVDHLARVVERLGGAAVDQPAHEPVEPVGAAEQHDLPEEVERPVREQAAERGRDMNQGC